MKTAFILSTLLVGAESFAVAPVSQGRLSSALFAKLPDDQLSADDKEIKSIQEKWSEIRHYDREEAESKLDGEWLEAYNRFYELYDEDMTKMEQIVKSLESYVDPPKVQKKSKGQKRRDAYARKLARSGQTA
mmetsp:Transcript_12942/g.24265  ORF Transcript_12942/g.24265 Transcript_12942/m.24265 type:complete len:132 (-) Transcript_12942:865-1260(-)